MSTKLRRCSTRSDATPRHARWRATHRRRSRRSAVLRQSPLILVAEPPAVEAVQAGEVDGVEKLEGLGDRAQQVVGHAPGEIVLHHERHVRRVAQKDTRRVTGDRRPGRLRLLGCRGFPRQYVGQVRAQVTGTYNLPDLVAPRERLRPGRPGGRTRRRGDFRPVRAGPTSSGRTPAAPSRRHPRRAECRDPRTGCRPSRCEPGRSGRGRAGTDHRR